MMSAYPQLWPRKRSPCLHYLNIKPALDYMVVAAEENIWCFPPSLAVPPVALIPGCVKIPGVGNHCCRCRQPLQTDNRTIHVERQQQKQADRSPTSSPLHSHKKRQEEEEFQTANNRVLCTSPLHTSNVTSSKPILLLNTTHTHGKVPPGEERPDSCLQQNPLPLSGRKKLITRHTRSLAYLEWSLQETSVEEITPPVRH